MPTISLGRALADPNLFARHFRNKSWAAWKVFLAALFAEPRPDDAGGLSRPDRADGVAYGALHRGGGDRRPAGRQVADSGVDCGLSGVLPRLCAVFGPGRGGDDRGDGGRQGAGAGDLPLCARALEGGADAGAADRQARHRDDRVDEPGRDRDRHGDLSHRPAATPYAAVLADEVAFWRSDETLAQSRCRDYAGAAAGPGDDSGRGVGDGVEPLRSGASSTTPTAGIRQGRRARPGLESLDRWR